MKKLLSIVTICVLLVSGSVYASFPVKNESTVQQTEISEKVDESKNLVDQKDFSKSEMKKALKKASSKDSSNSSKPDMELIITLLLWFFLGGFAAHRWYRGKPVGWNILFILTAGGCGVWLIIDLINILRGEF